jgi:type III restriction enzyme
VTDDEAEKLPGEDTGQARCFPGQGQIYDTGRGVCGSSGGPGYSGKYKALEKLEEIPYVCLRLPTGGGKTMLSAHAVAVATDNYLEVDYPIVLWLAPTDIIRSQTLETLKNPLHPNRAALDQRFGGRVRVFDITDFEQLRPQDIGQSVCIFLATFAAFRVNSTDGRRVYAHNENMEPHFSAIAPADYMEKNGHGEVKYSFANLLAHNRRSSSSTRPIITLAN